MGKYYAKAVEEFGGIEYATVEFKNKVFRRALQLKKENKQRKQTIIKSVTYSILTSIMLLIYTRGYVCKMKSTTIHPCINLWGCFILNKQ